MRRLVTLSGPDALPFLQGLVTNDVLPLAQRGIVYAALLTPQGKYLADFFVVNTGSELLLDLADAQADAVLKRLTMYKLRANVQLQPSRLQMSRGVGAPPADALPDPRHPALGWRLYGLESLDDLTNWTALRVEHLIPESGIELVADETYILEAGFERLHGVDFRKGCYVGQEVTARMKHKTEARKGLVQLQISGSATVGTPILMADGREAGTLFSQANGKALAHMRFDRMDGALTAGDAVLSRA